LGFCQLGRAQTKLDWQAEITQKGQMPVLDRDTFSANVSLGHIAPVYEGYDVSALHDALFCVFNRPEPVTHTIAQEPVLLEERIAYIEEKLESGDVLSFKELLNPQQGRMGMVVTFMAVLELTRQQKIKIIATGVEAPLAIQGSSI
jgi:segregation and condensation protein A